MEKQIFNYFTFQELIQEINKDYFIVFVQVKYINPETEIENYITVKIEFPFENAEIDLEKKYELSKDGINELKSDLFKCIEKDKDKILDLAKEEVFKKFEKFPDLKILDLKIIDVYLEEKMAEFLDELMKIDIYEWD